MERGEILLPRLYVAEVEVAVRIVVGILIAQTGKAVSELVDHDGAELHMVGGGQRIGIVDAATAIRAGIGQDDDVLVRNAGQQIVEVAHPQGSQVAVRIEGREVRTQCRVTPQAFERYADIRIARRGRHSHEVEAVSQPAKRLMGQNGIDRRLCRLIEVVGLSRRIAFGHDGHIDLVGRLSAAVQVAMGRHGHAVEPPDQDVVRVDCMRIFRLNPLVHAEQAHRDAGRIGRHRQQEAVFEGAAHVAGLIGGDPLLEQCAERLAVNHAPCARIAQRDVAVALQRHAVRVDTPSRPAFKAAQLRQGYFAGICIARELIVNTQGALRLRHGLG